MATDYTLLYYMYNIYIYVSYLLSLFMISSTPKPLLSQDLTLGDGARLLDLPPPVLFELPVLLPQQAHVAAHLLLNQHKGRHIIYTNPLHFRMSIKWSARLLET